MDSNRLVLVRYCQARRDILDGDLLLWRSEGLVAKAGRAVALAAGAVGDFGRHQRPDKNAAAAILQPGLCVVRSDWRRRRSSAATGRSTDVAGRSGAKPLLLLSIHALALKPPAPYGAG